MPIFVLKVRPDLIKSDQMKENFCQFGAILIEFLRRRAKKEDEKTAGDAP